MSELVSANAADAGVSGSCAERGRVAGNRRNGGGWLVSDCGGDVWRLQSTDGAGAVSDRGAVQALKEFLGESQSTPVTGPSRGRTERAPSGGWRFFAADGRLLAEICPVSRAADGRLVLSLPLAADEAVYGGGCRFDRLDKRGTSVRLRAEDGWNRPDTMYQPTPFFVTSRGAGIYLNTFASMTADVGASDKGVWRTTVEGDRMLDVYVFTRGTVEGNIAAFHELVGGVAPAPALRPGPIVCRHYGKKDFNTFEKIRRIYDEHVKAGVKPSALIIEPWPITKAFSNGQVRAELDAMGAFFRGEGVPLAIWTPCGSVIYPDMPGFKDDYLVHCDVFMNGVLQAERTTQVPALFENGSDNPDISTWYRHPPMLDVTNPEARDWFEKNVLGFLVEHNILGAKIDFCEFMADEGRVYGKDRLTVRYRWKDPSVFGDQSVHHAYPCFFNVNFYRSLKRIAPGRDDVFVFCRGGGGIGDMHTPYYWAGDQVRSFPKLREQLRAVLNSRLSGVPYMSYDMAGYMQAGASPDIEVEGRVFARAAEFTKFMPLMQTHGSVANFFEFSSEIRRIYADAVSFNAGHSGLVRPLVERWTDDPRAQMTDDEFLFGDNLLVAPVLDDAAARTVYLPEGVWTNELTGERIAAGKEGRTVEVAATLAETPTFRLAGLAGDAPDEAAILRTVNDRLAREFISHDGLMLDYVGDIPTPEEIADLKPNAMGWWCPIENGSMFTGEWLPALMSEGAGRKNIVEKCVRGLIKMSEVSDVPGFIARGTGTDGKSHHPCGSNDQTDPWFLGLCEYCRWPHADETLKAKALERLVFVAKALEKNGWGIPCDGPFKGQNRGNLNAGKMPFWGKTRLLYSLKSLERLTGDGHWKKSYDEIKASALDEIEAGGAADEKAFQGCYTWGVWIYLSSAEALARLIEMEENPSDRARMRKGFLRYAERVAPLMKDRAKYANTTERPFRYANWRTGYQWSVQKTQKEAEAVASSGKKEILGNRKAYERNGMANPLAAAAICALSGDAKFRDEIWATLRHYEYSTPNISEFFHAAIAAAALPAE